MATQAVGNQHLPSYSSGRLQGKVIQFTGGLNKDQIDSLTEAVIDGLKRKKTVVSLDDREHILKYISALKEKLGKDFDHKKVKDILLSDDNIADLKSFLGDLKKISGSGRPFRERLAQIEGLIQTQAGEKARNLFGHLPAAPLPGAIPNGILNRLREFLKSPGGRVLGGAGGGMAFGALEAKLNEWLEDGNVKYDPKLNAYLFYTTVARNGIAGGIAAGSGGIVAIFGIPTTGPLGAGAAFVTTMVMFEAVNMPLEYLQKQGAILFFPDAKLDDFTKGLPNNAKPLLLFPPLPQTPDSVASIEVKLPPRK